VVGSPVLAAHDGGDLGSLWIQEDSLRGLRDSTPSPASAPKTRFIVGEKDKEEEKEGPRSEPPEGHGHGGGKTEMAMQDYEMMTLLTRQLDEVSSSRVEE